MATVFVVEDEPSLQFFYKQILTLNGFKLAGIASDGEQAVSMFKSFSVKPSIILMDHRMPIKNGIEASKEILQIDNTAKIIVISAYDSIKETSQSIGASSFINKPFSNKKLINEINRVLQHSSYQTIQRDVISQLKW